MFKSYFSTAWRNLAKNKVFSIINITGLSIGIAACLLILQYVSFQLSFDRFNKNAADIFRVTNDRYQNGKLIQHGTITYSAVGKAMQDDFPEVINHTRMRPAYGVMITEDKKIGDQGGYFVDNAFLDMFSYPLIAGDKSTSLTAPFSLVLSQTLANTLFDKHSNAADMMGKVISFDGIPCKVTAICANPPENSHLKFKFLLSYNSLYSGPNPWKQSDYDFTDSDFWHYIQLRPGTDYKTVEAKLPAFSDRHFQGNKISGSVEKFYLQPLTSAHLYSDYEYELANTDSATIVWSMLIIAALIISIAWVNYINLSTAKSADRAREVGVRKVSGATRLQLIKQFLTESFVVNMIALGLAIILVTLLQPAFNHLIQYHLSLSYLFHNGLHGWNVIALLLAILVAGIFVSGFYPAFVLSSFKPIVVLKGKYTTSSKGIHLRRILVVSQFAITIALIIGSFVVYSQMRYISKQDLGINLSQVLVVRGPGLTQFDSTFITRSDAFKDELKKIPHVQNVANSWSVAADEMGRDFDLSLSSDEHAPHFTTRKVAVSPEFVPMYGIRLLAGRNFDATDYNVDRNKVHSILLNQNVSKLLGFAKPDDAIGKTIHVEGKQWDVIGVISDFHQKSLRYPLEPLILMPLYSTNSAISVRVDTKDITATMKAIQAQYDAYFPGNLFDYYFLDARFNQQYANDQLFGRIFGIFSALAISIACLGLLGLSLFTTTQRTKEIGVRKVMGASVANIIVLLSKDFIKLVCIAFLIAAPVAWLVMNHWLSDFAYRINISVWIFVVAALLSVFIALATISFQAVKAALANPVKSLRTDG
ncbi:ABC transporter permease [Chitinophaga sp. 212800010-3]|uniref:ABC transporter permease n=1 Tax=unclassified Chitinophaga TaxID=2619133 RepID=UPI002DEF8F60|nr:ABC transporter permease [Chitinophaga sp. 212800010-3]